MYYKHICEGGWGVKIDFFRPRSAECDGNSEKYQNTHECVEYMNASDAGNKPIIDEKL